MADITAEIFTARFDDMFSADASGPVAIGAPLLARVLTKKHVQLASKVIVDMPERSRCYREPPGSRSRDCFLCLDSNPTPSPQSPHHMAGTRIDTGPWKSRWSAAPRDLMHAALGLLAATRPRIWGLRAARWEPGGDFGHPRCARAGMRAVVCAARLRAACAWSAGVAIALVLEMRQNLRCEYRLCVV